MANELSEKRRSKRVDLVLPVSGICREGPSDLHPFHGETRDVSFEGLCIKINSSRGFKVGEDIDFKTRLYRGDFLLKARGRVCWIHILSDPDWPALTGVSVTNMRHSRLWVERIEDRIIQIS